MIDSAVRCDSCPLKAACPCYVPGKRACVVGANFTVSLWTAAVALAAVVSAVIS